MRVTYKNFCLIKSPWDYCPGCGEKYYNVCAYAWCPLPCNKYWSGKELEKWVWKNIFN